jgi:dipeptidyl aminopeptidase/acylaminoacyl peptidase
MWNLYPQISPDGRRLAFVSTQSGSHELWVAARDGTAARQVTNFGGEPQARSRGTSVRGPRWSPDSTRIVLAAHRHGASDVFIVHAETDEVTAVTSDVSVEIAPSWSSDGAHIYYGVRSGDGWNIWAREVKAYSEPVLVVPNGFAAQSAPDGSLFFTRATESGLWRSAAGRAATLVTDRVQPGDWANWSVTSRGIFLVARSGRDVVLRHVALDGGEVRQVAVLENYSWPGFTITPDGSYVLYPRWDRRQSNIVAAEMTTR